MDACAEWLAWAAGRGPRAGSFRQSHQSKLSWHPFSFLPPIKAGRHASAWRPYTIRGHRQVPDSADEAWGVQMGPSFKAGFEECSCNEEASIDSMTWRRARPAENKSSIACPLPDAALLGPFGRRADRRMESRRHGHAQQRRWQENVGNEPRSVVPR